MPPSELELTELRTKAEKAALDGVPLQADPNHVLYLLDVYENQRDESEKIDELETEIFDLRFQLSDARDLWDED